MDKKYIDIDSDIFKEFEKQIADYEIKIQKETKSRHKKIYIIISLFTFIVIGCITLIYKTIALYGKSIQTIWSNLLDNSFYLLLKIKTFVIFLFKNLSQ